MGERGKGRGRRYHTSTFALFSFDQSISFWCPADLYSVILFAT